MLVCFAAGVVVTAAHSSYVSLLRLHYSLFVLCRVLIVLQLFFSVLYT